MIWRRQLNMTRIEVGVNQGEVKMKINHFTVASFEFRRIVKTWRNFQLDIWWILLTVDS